MYGSSRNKKLSLSDLLSKFEQNTRALPAIPIIKISDCGPLRLHVTDVVHYIFTDALKTPHEKKLATEAKKKLQFSSHL